MAKKPIELGGLVSNDDLDSVYKKRNVKYVYKKILKTELDKEVKNGWEKTGFKGKTHNRVRRFKDIGPGFEDEVWCMFKRMTFEEMNKDANFTIPRMKSPSLSKQIDVFAKDEQCIILVECKAAKIPHTKRQLDKDIDQMATIKHETELSIYSHYKSKGITKKLKIIWILALKNIDISNPDLERAKCAKIKVMPYEDIEYYNNLTAHFGPASKYQFLSDVLPGIDIPDLLDPIPAIRGTMGNTNFYSFVIEPDKLLKISYLAHRSKTTEESMDTYQRMAKKNRLKKIAEYITEKDGIFPTSIVINIESKRPVKFEAAKGTGGKNVVLGTLYLPNKYKSAWIIDGQHRLYAYSGLDESNTATLPVIAFENLETQTQAQMFVDINGEQVKVPKSHLTDLWADIHINSSVPTDQIKAMSSKLVKELDVDKNSPLRDRIIKPGMQRVGNRTITYTAIADEIRRGKILGSARYRDKSITPGHLWSNDSADTVKRGLKIISGYFENYLTNNSVLADQWELGKGEGGFICTNGGIRTLLRILKNILDHIVYHDKVAIQCLSEKELIEKIWKYQKPVSDYLGRASEQALKDYRKKSASESGVTATTNGLIHEIYKQHPSFEPDGLKDYIRAQTSPNNKNARDIHVELELTIMNHVIDTLQDHHGNNLSEWWTKGIPKKVQKIAMELAIDKGDITHPEKSLNFIHWYDIILDNFDLFESEFTLDVQPGKTGKKNSLAWLIKINEIRNFVFHPPSGALPDEDLEYQKKIYEELKSNIDNL
ncbi:MAG: DGQHR domain-containing protein [Candidatus Peribacteraceae bacterium]|nr:DGQHR domain-containing protein [Candidatus Peribacteraceae bacterium]